MNYIVKIFNYQFYVKELLVLLFGYLLMENIFSWLLLPNSVILLAYEKGLSIVIFGYVLYYFNNLKTNEKIYVSLFTGVIIMLVIESMLKYGTYFQQFTMFSILFPVIFTVFIKCVCRSLKLDLLEFLAKFYLITYIAFMAIYGRGFSFSLQAVEMDDYGPFSGDSRIIHARSILMMILPLLWYLHKFINQNKIKYLLPVIFCITVIVVHQHRSVWASTIVALLVYLFISLRNKVIAVPKVWSLLIGSLAGLVLVWFIIYNLYPGFTDFLGDRFSEILDPKREGGTAEFRALQRDVYGKLFLQKPIFGWTFEGFNMPNPLVDWWPVKSGQHFHEGYMEMLFYHGFVGFLLKYWFLIYLGYKAFSKNLSQESVILIAFSTVGIVFSFSYVLPLVFWGHVGVCLYYLEKTPVELDDDVLENELMVWEEDKEPEMTLIENH